MNRIVKLLLLLSISAIYAEGTITGNITDKVTREPLIGVAISIVDTELGAATGINGDYTITDIEPGVYRLEITYLGYEPVIKTDINVISGRPTRVDVSLRQQVIEGEGVVVTSDYFEETINATMSTVSLSREEIRRFPGGFEDVVRTVSTLPGVAINSAGGRNDLLVRGGGPSENLYVINGIEVPNINHFGTQGSSSGSLSFVNLDFVDNVEFSTGGFSSRFGDKMSSVLTLDLTEGRKDAFGGKALLSATQYGLNLEGPIGNSGDFLFSARKSYLDLLFKVLGQPFIPVYSDINLIADIDLTPKDNLFILSLTALDEVERTLDTSEDRVRNAGLLDNTQNQFINGLVWRRLLSDGFFQATLNVNHNEYKFAQADTADVTYFRSNASETEFAAGLNFVWSLNKNWNVIAGVKAKSIRNDNKTDFADTIYDLNGNAIARPAELPATTRFDETFNKYGAYTEFEWQNTSGFDVKIGLRYDHYAALNTPNYLSPRLGITYQLNDKISLKTSVGTYHQPPANVWLVNDANRDLKALRNDMFIIGGDYRLGPDYKVKVETYYKDYSDLPTGTVAGINDYIVQTNTGASFGGREDNFQSFGFYPLVSEAFGESYGVEVSLQKKLSDTPFYGQMSLSWGKSEYTAFNGRVYPGLFDQRWIFNLFGGYRLNRNWEFSGKFRFFTGVPFTPVYRPDDNPVNPGQVQNLPDEYLSDRIDAGHQLDVRVDRYFFFENYTIIAFLDIQNIYAFEVPQRPNYDFWEDKVQDRSTLSVLPSIGVSLTF